MARSFLTLARSMAAAGRAAENQMERDRRRQARAQKANERVMAAMARVQKLRAVEGRKADVDELNRQLAQTVDDLQNLLTNALENSSAIDFESLKVNPHVPEIQLGNLGNQYPAPQWAQFEPPKPSAIFGWLPWKKKDFDERLTHAKDSFAAARTQHTKAESDRQAAIAKLRDEREEAFVRARAEAAKQNTLVDEWRVAFDNGEREAVEEYCQLVLTNSTYPDDFPKESKLAFVTESHQLVVEYDLPVMEEVIPKQKGFTYVKTSDKVNEVARPEKDRRALYSSVIAQCALRCIHELFCADTEGIVETIVFNGHVDTINPGTGQGIHPCLVTVRATRDQFLSINLHKAEPIAALQTLSASFSRSPAELAAVRPLLEFNMVDRRFIQESDVLSTLDQRPNLMDLSPGDFESLITNLFQKMGLETKLTQASRDGGVDCVAYDPRPIFGGKVVIQAKRYKNTVGVSAVRDLFGTMQNEGASKGILVTTSGYGKASFDFAAGKPLELLDGGNLLFLLKEHAGIEARIVMPDDWKDPVMDSGS